MAASDWFSDYQLPVQQWVEGATRVLSAEWRPVFQIVKVPLNRALDGLADFLMSLPPPLVLALLFLAVWQMRGTRPALWSLALMIGVGLCGVWADTMRTLALIFASVALCLAVGFPLGTLAGQSNALEKTLAPILDTMQTLPSFVYLVPIVLLVGIGDLPGVIVTFVFAVPPIIRLTSLGLRNVPRPIIEAAEALGSSPLQILVKVQLPLAAPTILVGVNQTIIMALAMVTYASMIGVDGLGQLVLRGIGRLDLGLATVGGIGIVALAMVFSRIILPEAKSTSVRASRGPTPLQLVARAVTAGRASLSRQFRSIS
jgi:glycine betaine/proline transport system permease protein